MSDKQDEEIDIDFDLTMEEYDKEIEGRLEDYKGLQDPFVVATPTIRAYRTLDFIRDFLDTLVSKEDVGLSPEEVKNLIGKFIVIKTSVQQITGKKLKK